MPRRATPVETPVASRATAPLVPVVLSVLVLVLVSGLVGCGSGSDRSETPPSARSAPLPAPVALPAAAWRPKPGLTWQIQYEGRLDLALEVDAWNVDLVETPQATIDRLQRDGRKVICYFSAGSWEEFRPDAAQFPRRILGRPLEGWPGERWLDVRAPALRPLLLARLDLAVAKHCDAVDPDNVDGYDNGSGFAITQADQVRFVAWLANEAHRRGMAVSLKNGLGLVTDVGRYVDFEVNEQCVEYGECSRLAGLRAAGKPVLGIEYAGSTSVVCTEARRRGFDTLRKRLALDAWRVACG